MLPSLRGTKQSKTQFINLIALDEIASSSLLAMTKLQNMWKQERKQAMW
jgi:hypothetical protein